jgi:hypothetical protein
MDVGSALAAALVDEDGAGDDAAELDEELGEELDVELDDEHAANASVATATLRTAVVLSLLVTIMEPDSFVGVR